MIKFTFYILYTNCNNRNRYFVLNKQIKPQNKTGKLLLFGQIGFFLVNIKANWGKFIFVLFKQTSKGGVLKIALTDSIKYFKLLYFIEIRNKHPVLWKYNYWWRKSQRFWEATCEENKEICMSWVICNLTKCLFLKWKYNKKVKMYYLGKWRLQTVTVIFWRHLETSFHSKNWHWSLISKLLEEITFNWLYQGIFWQN